MRSNLLLFCCVLVKVKVREFFSCSEIKYVLISAFYLRNFLYSAYKVPSPPPNKSPLGYEPTQNRFENCIGPWLITGFYRHFPLRKTFVHRKMIYQTRRLTKTKSSSTFHIETLSFLCLTEITTALPLHQVPNTLHDKFVNLIRGRRQNDLRGRKDCFYLEQRLTSVKVLVKLLQILCHHLGIIKSETRT